jgi:hypothetical protein
MKKLPIKSKVLLDEVTEIIETEMNFRVFDSFSDGGNKYSIARESTDPSSNQKYELVCEFAVHKRYNKESFVIWDWRTSQPGSNNKHCVADLRYGWGLGRYEFDNRESFFEYITSECNESLLSQISKN